MFISRGAEDITSNRAPEQITTGPGRDHHAHRNAQPDTPEDVGDHRGHSREKGAVGRPVQDDENNQRANGRAERPDQQHAYDVEHEGQDEGVESTEDVCKGAAA